VRAFLVIAALAATAGLARGEVIDRILAVVDGAVIMQSDVAGATRLELVTVPAGPDLVGAVLERLIERRLMLAEVDRYAPPDPVPAAVDLKVQVIRARLGAAALDAVLQRTGISLDQLRREVRDELRIDSYLQQRFGAVQPSEADIVQYYREHTAEFTPRTLDEVHDAVRAAVIDESRAGMIRDWVGGLRRRANINVLPR
jgi:parvulin-like peptidyl-prolyl isomerase